MFPKTFSLCVLILFGVAGAAAQFQPGPYNIRGAALDPNIFPPAQVRNGSNQPLLVSVTPPAENSDVWNLIPGSGGGLIMQNIAFNTFLKVPSTNSGAPVTTDTDQNQATSFAITSAGLNQFHINVVGQDLVWTLPTAVAGGGPPPDMVVRAEQADGRPEQLWSLNKL
ncbi:hypothetical protein BD779DRAFT_1676211 [Infundibulicybe gibba]|nr:hypothetical protein BD779DRAFT_1676211 [Infundibulicybe gibba]